jgi:ribosomal protein S10
MTFVTTLTLSSGDRRVLDDVVADIKERASRKGVEFKGPHPKPPEEYSVPRDKRLDGSRGDRFDAWRYTVYTRTLRIVGHDGFAREVAGRSYPDAVHVEAEVEQVSGAGRT